MSELRGPSTTVFLRSALQFMQKGVKLNDKEQVRAAEENSGVGDR